MSWREVRSREQGLFEGEAANRKSEQRHAKRAARVWAGFYHSASPFISRTSPSTFFLRFSFCFVPCLPLLCSFSLNLFRYLQFFFIFLLLFVIFLLCSRLALSPFFNFPNYSPSISKHLTSTLKNY